MKFPRLPLVLAACLMSAVAAAAHAATVTATWTAPTTNTDGTAISATLSYNLYQGATCTTLTKVQSGLTTPTATVTTGLTAGASVCFTVTAVANAIESAQSNTALAAIPFPTPGTPTQITVVVH